MQFRNTESQVKINIYTIKGKIAMLVFGSFVAAPDVVPELRRAA